MEPVIELTDEEFVSRILGLPMERVVYLKTECGMLVSEPEFSTWFVENAALVLAEKKAYFEASLFPRKFRPEPAEPSA